MDINRIMGRFGGGGRGGGRSIFGSSIFGKQTTNDKPPKLEDNIISLIFFILLIIPSIAYYKTYEIFQSIYNKK